MVIKSLELLNYRNYKSLKLDLSEKTNILYGDNAQGKTNVLEAVYVCATTKSHKGSKDREMIRFGCEDAHLRMFIERRGALHKIDMHLKNHKNKGVAVDGSQVKRSSELMGLIHVVFFSPEDLAMIKNGPSYRRRFIDMELCQLDKMYLYRISGYNKVIAQRNNLLKQIGFQPELKDTLDVWDVQLADYGKRIIRARRDFIDALNGLTGPIHEKLTGGRERLTVRYEPNVSEERFEEQIFLQRDHDLMLKTTGTGPHRDDISFYINDVDIRKYGSQGQQRTAALSLKLAEIELVRQAVNDTPVLLLDDVLSELDSFRQNYLLESINDTQTIITCTGLDDFINSRFDIDRVFKVVNGEIEESH